MRHFMLVNSANEVLNITTEEVLFHDIGGLGFDEDNDFRHIGEVWWLNHTTYKQGSVSGKMMFTENGGTDPYAKFWEFTKFISKPPLTLLYNPNGPIQATILGDKEDGETTYYRTVRVSKLEKSEKTELGVIDESIEFIAYTPWYKIEKDEIVPSDSEEEDTGGWIWGGPTGSDLVTVDDSTDPPTETAITFPQDYGEADPLVFEPDGAVLEVPDYETEPTEENPYPITTVTIPAYSGNCSPARFRFESATNINLTLESDVKSPVKLTIFGPIVKPTWSHSVVRGNVSTAVGTGAFTSTVSLTGEEYLVIDNTGGQYQIYKRNANGTITDLYDQRRFDLACFINLREGTNQISVVGQDGPAKHVLVEGHKYYAAV